MTNTVMGNTTSIQGKEELLFGVIRMPSWRKWDLRWVLEVEFELAKAEGRDKHAAAAHCGSQRFATKMGQIMAFSRKDQ